MYDYVKLRHCLFLVKHTSSYELVRHDNVRFFKMEVKRISKANGWLH